MASAIHKTFYLQAVFRESISYIEKVTNKIMLHYSFKHKIH